MAEPPAPDPRRIEAAEAADAGEGLRRGLRAEARPGASIRLAPGAPGLERLQAAFTGRPFAPHRHDTYAIGLTTAGVQAFRYRGRAWACRPGELHVLHPDELHDGRAATAAGFVYRMVYVDPARVQQALGGRPLPFVAEPVRAAGTALAEGLWSLDDAGEPGPIDPLREAELVAAATALLVAAAGGPGADARPTLALAGLSRVRERLLDAPANAPAIDALEALAGLDRWTLARQFRAAYGTSPSRFRVQRQVDLARRALQAGASIADAALAAGFADQSHFTRQFKRVVGLPPGRWRAALASISSSISDQIDYRSQDIRR